MKKTSRLRKKKLVGHSTLNAFLCGWVLGGAGVRGLAHNPKWIWQVHINLREKICSKRCFCIDQSSSQVHTQHLPKIWCTEHESDRHLITCQHIWCFTGAVLWQWLCPQNIATVCVCPVMCTCEPLLVTATRQWTPMSIRERVFCILSFVVQYQRVGFYTAMNLV